MKKRMLILVALLLAAVLTGCACKHEWTEADCLNPQVCTKCEEVGAEALGHDYAPATCNAPETCARCGETRGEKLEHVMGSWQFEGEEMFKTCEACGMEERTAIDRELYLKEQLIGFWDFAQMHLEGTDYDSNDLNYGYVGEFIRLYGDGTALYFDMQDEIDLTWEYVGFEVVDDIDVYTISASSEATGTYDIYIQDAEGEDVDMLYYYMAGGDYVILARHAPFAPALEGNWVATSNGSTYSLTLNPDHSFTLDTEPAISGTWHTKDLAYYGTSMEDATASLTVMLRYPSADGHRVVTSSIYLGDALQTQEEMLAYMENSNYLSVYLDELGTSLNFQKMDPEELEALKQANAEGEQKLLGTWTSKTFTLRNYETDESETTVTTDYTVTFAEDGTVTLKLDEALTGTWQYEKAQVSGSYVSYNYDLTIDADESNWSVYLSSENDLSISKYEDNQSTEISFGQLSEEDKAKVMEGPQLPVGTWSCSERSWYDSAAQKMISEAGEYSATFHEDGTFTLQLDETLNGTWSFYDYSPEWGFEYRLQYEGLEGGSIYTLNHEGFFSFHKDTDDIYYQYYMAKN